MCGKFRTLQTQACFCLQHRANNLLWSDLNTETGVRVCVNLHLSLGFAVLAKGCITAGYGLGQQWPRRANACADISWFLCRSFLTQTSLMVFIHWCKGVIAASLREKDSSNWSKERCQGLWLGLRCCTGGTVPLLPLHSCSWLWVLPHLLQPEPLHCHWLAGRDTVVSGTSLGTRSLRGLRNEPVVCWLGHCAFPNTGSVPMLLCQTTPSSPQQEWLLVFVIFRVQITHAAGVCNGWRGTL